MAVISNTFTSDDREVMKSLEKMHGELVKLRDENRRLAESAKQGSQEVSSAHERVGETIMAILGAEGIRGGIEKLVGAYGQWREEILKVGEEAGKTGDKVQAAIAASGQLVHGVKIEQAIKGAAGTTEQNAQVFAGISAGAPSLPLDEQLALLSAGSRAARVQGLDLGAYSKIFGEVSDQATHLSPADRADLALKLQQSQPLSGQLADASVLRSVAIGQTEGLGSYEEMLAMAVEGLDQNLGARFLPKLTAAVAGDVKTFDRQKLGRELTDEEKRQNAYAAMSTQERFAALKADETLQQQMLGQTDAQQFRQFDWQRVSRRAADFASVTGEDYLGEQAGLSTRTRRGRQLAEEQERARRRERGGARSREEDEAEDARRFDAAFEESLQGQNFAARALARTGRKLHGIVGGIAGYSEADIARDYARQRIEEVSGQGGAFETGINALVGTDTERTTQVMLTLLGEQKHAERERQKQEAEAQRVREETLRAQRRPAAIGGPRE